MFIPHYVSHVTCHVSLATCHMSPVTCKKITIIMIIIKKLNKKIIFYPSEKLDKVVEIVGGGSVINMAYPV